MKGLAARAHLVPSATLAVTERVRHLRAQGRDVIDLGGGDPDFPTPSHIVDAAVAALRAGDTHYVESAGVVELREALAVKLRRDNAVTMSADDVVVTPGAKAALYDAISALVEPGVDAMVLEPAWVSYRPMIEAAGGQVRAVPLSADDAFTVTRAALEAHVTAATRVLVVNSPNNPTGRVLRGDELDALAAFACAHDLTVIADEVYEHLVYPPHRHVSLASLPGMAGRTLTVNGFSKAWAMTGWRLGYVAGPRELVKPIKVLHGHMVSCASSFGQRGALAALTGPVAPRQVMVDAWERRGRWVCERLSASGALRCAPPEGAFYAFVDVRGTGLSDAVTFSRRLLDEAWVAVTPGDAFGASGRGHVRLSFAKSDADLERGVERLEAFVRGLGPSTGQSSSVKTAVEETP